MTLSTGNLPALLRVRAATERFGLSKSTIYRWLEAGTIRGVKVGNSTYIKLDSLIEAIEALPAYKSAA